MSGLRTAPASRALAPDQPLVQAVTELGGKPVARTPEDWPAALVGDAEPPRLPRRAGG